MMMPIANTEASDALIAALENTELDGEANDAKVDFLKDKDYLCEEVSVYLRRRRLGL